MAPIVGIDLGTTNSLVAYMDRGIPRIIPDPDSGPLVPSVISVDEQDAVLVGRAGLERLVVDPHSTVFSVKRLMGRGIEDARQEIELFHFPITSDSQQVIRLKLRSQVFTPPEVSAHILQRLKLNAEKFFGEPVNQAVITVPAYFNDAQRQATKDAGRIAGLGVVRLVNEPTAASLAYGLDKRKQGLVAVYDLGGGTFDISILKLKDGIFEVVSTNGDTHLGGDDVDARMIALVIATLKQQTGVDWSDHDQAVQLIRRAVIEAKHQLTDQQAASIAFALPDAKRTRVEIPMTRPEFENLVRPVIERTLPPVRQALADAKLQPGELDEVVLVGGATRMPMVRHLVEEIFGKIPHTELNPDQVVALGAAVQADILAGGTQDMLLLDVTPLSLGIETLGGAVAKILLRNSTIPASATQMFTTLVDGQTSVDIHVVQGERELVKDCRSLGRFKLRVPPLPAGMPRIEVRFLIDANGILNVTARDVRTGTQQSVDVRPSYGLTDAEVEKMLLESFAHAEEDLSERLAIDARHEAEIVIHATEKALAGPAATAISSDECLRIETALNELKRVLPSDSHELIRRKTNELNQATQHLAALIMDSTVKQALEGKKLEDVK